MGEQKIEPALPAVRWAGITIKTENGTVLTEFQRRERATVLADLDFHTRCRHELRRPLPPSSDDKSPND